MELDEVESCNETFPLTRAFVNLLDVLTDVPVPKALGAGHRSPGFEPYLDFLLDSVFLKFNTRAYKNTGEKVNLSTEIISHLFSFSDSDTNQYQLDEFSKYKITVRE